LVEVIKRLAGKKPWYWLKVAIIIVIGLYLGHSLDEEGYLTGPRYKMSQFLQSLTPFPPYPKHTALVLIQDEEYWRGEPEGRVPIKRDYIGKLMEALDKANAAVIAIDFDLRSQSAPGSDDLEQPGYRAETDLFCKAVWAASQRRKVILPKTISLTHVGKDDYFYETKPDIYDKCDFGGGRVSKGYIALPPDTRLAPLLSLEVKGGPPLDSFSQAIARAHDEDVLRHLRETEELPYASFINQEEFEKKVVSAGDLLKGEPAALKRVENKVVILSGAWHSQGFETGMLIDSYDTPAGIIPGAFIHANYVEAMLDSRIFRTWGGWTLVIIEILLSLCVALPFALEIRALQKLLAVVFIGLVTLVFSYFSLRNLGLFFDPFIPLILVAAHGAFEQIREWRADAHKYYLSAHKAGTA
jgi:CHASE2 domain-containing sensor protein